MQTLICNWVYDRKENSSCDGSISSLVDRCVYKRTRQCWINYDFCSLIRIWLTQKWRSAFSHIQAFISITSIRSMLSNKEGKTWFNNPYFQWKLFQQNIFQNLALTDCQGVPLAPGWHSKKGFWGRGKSGGKLPYIFISSESVFGWVSLHEKY